MTLTCSIVQFIMWWCWAVHSSRTCWALWAWEELAWNASGRKYHRTCATGEQLEINAIIQPLAERENTGLTGCFSGRMLFNDRWVAVKDFPPIQTKHSVMLYNNIYTLNYNKRDYSRPSYNFSFQLLTFSFAFLNKMKLNYGFQNKNAQLYLYYCYVDVWLICLRDAIMRAPAISHLSDGSQLAT